MKIKIFTCIIIFCLATVLVAEASTLYILKIHNTYNDSEYIETVVDPLDISHPNIDNPDRVVVMIWIYDYYYETNEETQSLELASTTLTSYWWDNQGGSGTYTVTY